MKFAAVAALASGLMASAMPTAYPIYSRQMSGSSSGPTDVQILQYALTLENLEKTFYAQALSKFSDSDFTNAGYPSWVRARFSQIAGHESDHVSFLSAALGNQSVAACTYNFPYTDVKSFISLASLIENVGVSAYAGAAQYIKTPAYVTAAAIILTTEARHQAWENADVQGLQAWSSAYDTPLGLNMVYTIASAFITSCPASNPALPVKSYGALTVSNAVAGQTASYTFDNSKQGSTVEYAVYYNGLGAKAVQLDVNHKAMVPSYLPGISYVLISTQSDPTKVADGNIVAGPAIVVNNFSAYVADPPFTS